MKYNKLNQFKMGMDGISAIFADWFYTRAYVTVPQAKRGEEARRAFFEGKLVILRTQLPFFDKPGYWIEIR